MIKIIQSILKIKKKKAVIIRYQGGLGNQMFQYALKIKYNQLGYKTYDDLSFYYKNKKFMPFVLNSVFPNISIKGLCRFELLTKIVRKLVKNTSIYKKEINYTKFSEDILNQSGWLEGYWQSYKYYLSVRNELLKLFEFKEIQEKQLIEIEKQIKNCNSVSVHIRAGDYLNEVNRKNFGGICTKAYYEKSIKYIKEHINNPIFYIFSDDLEWSKKNINITNAIYMDNKKIHGYEDWIDMYFMSICQNNIIANSSFSWWAAWLNTNTKNIVIAPSKWANNYGSEEVCPSEWILI